VDELSTLDALFLHLEDSQVALHIGAVAVFDGRCRRAASSAAAMSAQWRRAPRYAAAQRTCDRAAVPDADLFVADMADGLADLVKSAVTATEPC
jgi:hypothetical protein